MNHISKPFSAAQLHAIRDYFDRRLQNPGPAARKPAGVPDGTAQQLQQRLVDDLELELFDTEERRLAYWALSKRFDRTLIPYFQKWLQAELKRTDGQAVFQLMIALDNLEEPIFDRDRTGFASFEVDRNFQDARTYLSNRS